MNKTISIKTITSVTLPGARTSSPRFSRVCGRDPRSYRSFTITLIAFLLTLFCANAFTNTATIEVGGENKYKAVRLTPEIYNAANSDLSDILIKDENGENVPYFINSVNRTIYETDRQSHLMTLINSYTKDDSFYFDYKASNIPDRDIVATSIELTTGNTGFAKNIELYGSYDNINWEFVQNDAIYSVDGKSKLGVEFNKIQKYTHYRFKLGNNLERISFGSAALVYNYFTQEKIYFIESIMPQFSVEEKEKKTYINIEGLKNLRIGEIIIETDSMFHRPVSAPSIFSMEIYNLYFNGAAYTNTAIPFNWHTSRDSVFVMTIDNGDDKPINIKGITVGYYADELVFDGGKSGTFTLHFGADDTKNAPVYDIDKYKHEILKDDIDRAYIKDVVFDSPIKETDRYDYKTVFNVVVAAVAMVLGFLIAVRLRKKPDPDIS